MVAFHGLTDVLVVGDAQVSAAVHGTVEILGNSELVTRLESEFAEHILVVGVDSYCGIIDLPLGVAADRAAADDGIVAQVIEGTAIVGVQIKVDCGIGVGERLRLLPALARSILESSRAGRGSSRSLATVVVAPFFVVGVGLR